MGAPVQSCSNTCRLISEQMDRKMRYCRSRKASVPVLQFSDMDYSTDFSDPIKSRSLSTSTPLASKSLSLSSMCSPGNDSGYPDSIAESILTADETAFLDSTVTTHLMSTDCSRPEDFQKNIHPKCDTCENYTCECSAFNDWEIPEEEEVFEKKKQKRLSDFPRYSLEFESTDLDSSFGASCLAEKLDSVAIHDVVQHFSPREPDRLIGRKIGIEKVDILSEMSARNLQGVSMILSFLEPQDLCRLRGVCRQWKTMCDGDSRARAKRNKYLKSVKLRASSVGKENVGKSLSSRQQRGLTTATALTIVQNTQHVPRSPKKMPVANLFAQAVSTLQSDETLRHCPKCNSPAKAHVVEDRGVCINERCKYDFCIKCFCEHHGARNCIPVATKKSKLDSVGSKKSKKNLRRL